MKITILGCGSSGGVPLIGNNWGACDPDNPRNLRTRVSVLVEKGSTALLVDTSPDMRAQLLAVDCKKLDAVLFTHSHADHSHGIDELRSINFITRKPVDVYADATTMQELKTRFDYIFNGTSDKFYKPSATPHIINGAFELGGINITPFAQQHLNMQTLGFRFDDFAYSTDVKTLDEAAFAALKGVKAWVVDCVRREPHPSHSHLAQTLEWIAKIKPQQAYLTHMNQSMDYATLAAELPAGVAPAYDGLVIEC